MTEQEILKEIGEPLKNAIWKDLEMPAEANRQAQIQIARRNQLYFEGKQYLVPVMAGDGRSWDWKPVTAESNTGEKKQFASTYNIIQADGLKFMSVVGQRAPNMKAVAENHMEQGQVLNAKRNNIAIRHLHRQWKAKGRIKDIAFYLWTVGPVFLHTQYVVDGHRYGTIDVPEIEDREIIMRPSGMRCDDCGTIAEGLQCPTCGAPMSMASWEPDWRMNVPVQVGTKQVPRGDIDLKIYTCMEVGVPFGATSLEECDWLSLDLMESPHRLKAMYGDEAMTDADGGVSAAIRDAQDAKDQIESPAGVMLADGAGRVLHSKKWIRPSVYHTLSSRQAKMLTENYPDGLRITMVGGKVISLSPQRMDDYWSVIKTGTGPRISSAALCNETIPIQDDVNDFFNMGKETILRGIPKTFVNSELIDREAFKKNSNLIGEIVPVKLQGNQTVSSMMGELPRARMNDQMLPFGEKLREYSREIDGVQPAIFGGGPPTSTFREANQRKNQALMQLQPPVDLIMEGFRAATENGVKELERYGVGRIKVPGKDALSPSLEMDLADLSTEGVTVEAEESTPTTLGEKQDRIAQVSAENPALADALGFNDPMNTEAMQTMFGVEGLYSPKVQQREKILDTVQRLLAEPPIPQVDPMTGEQFNVPTIQPDRFEDADAMFCAAVVRAWCLSEAGMMQRQDNPDGYANVVAYGEAHDERAMAMAMPPPEEAPPAGDGPPALPPIE